MSDNSPIRSSGKRQLSSDRPGNSPDGLRPFLDIGRITAPHGINGEVRVFPMTDRVERFNELTECFLTAPDESSRKVIRIQSVRSNPPSLLVRIEGVDDRNAAEKLRGWLLTVDRAHAIALPEDNYFICDLIGCQVSDTRHGLLGRLTDIMQNMAHDVYVVSSPGQADVLIPVLKHVVHHVDMEARTIDVTLPDGLYEIYRRIPTGQEAD